MNYLSFKQHRSKLNAKSIVLTHMGPNMLAHVDGVEELCAFDGMVATL
jgi:hypothetical protein